MSKGKMQWNDGEYLKRNIYAMDTLDSYQKSIFAKCKLLRPAYMPIIGVETYQDKQFIVI